MPTWALVQRFERDWANLTPEQRAAFRHARDHFVEDLRRRKGFRAGLRVKGLQGKNKKGIYEMTWAPDGRATFQYGPEQRPGETHIIWRRIGTHSIFDQP